MAAAFVEHCRRYPEGGWDAWMIWDLRARFLVRAPDFRDAFSPQMLPWAHQDYPWLLPGAVTQLWRATGGGAAIHLEFEQGARNQHAVNFANVAFNDRLLGNVLEDEERKGKVER